MTPPETEPRLPGMKVGRIIGVLDSDAERLGEVDGALDCDVETSLLLSAVVD